MIDKDFKIPFYARITIFIVGLFVFITMLYIARSIIAPLVFAVIITFFLYQAVNFCAGMYFNRVIAVPLWFSIYVLNIYYIIQLIDNNHIAPKIAASKVKIIALVSIIVVIAGNALWGLTGMFLAIPIIAIVKLIFDHIEPLKPRGFLSGDTLPQFIEIKTMRLQKIIKILHAED